MAADNSQQLCLPPGELSAATSTPVPLPSAQVSMLQGCYFQGSIVFTECSASSVYWVPQRQCSGRKGARRQPREKHWLSDPGTETVIHSWISSWRRFAANLGRRGNLRSYKYLILLAELIILCKQNVLSCWRST